MSSDTDLGDISAVSITISIYSAGRNQRLHADPRLLCPTGHLFSLTSHFDDIATKAELIMK